MMDTGCGPGGRGFESRHPPQLTGISRVSGSPWGPVLGLLMALSAPAPSHAQTVCTGVGWDMTGKIRPGSVQMGQVQYVNAEIPPCAGPGVAPEWSVTFVDANGGEAPVQFTVLADPRTIYFTATQNGVYRVRGTIWWDGNSPSTSAGISFRRGALPPPAPTCTACQ